jgi:hypothetical protein
MPTRRVKGTPLDASIAIELSELATSVADAVLGAKLRLDRRAIAVADQYKASPALSLLAPPAFAIGEVRVTIKFAIAQVERSVSRARRPKRGRLHLRVRVDAASLAEIAPHLVSEIELRIAPDARRAQPTTEDEESSE